MKLNMNATISRTHYGAALSIEVSEAPMIQAQRAFHKAALRAAEMIDQEGLHAWRIDLGILGSFRATSNPEDPGLVVGVLRILPGEADGAEERALGFAKRIIFEQST